MMVVFNKYLDTVMPYSSIKKFFERIYSREYFSLAIWLVLGDEDLICWWITSVFSHDLLYINNTKPYV